MKLYLLSSLLLLSSFASASLPIYQPVRVSYESLLAAKESNDSADEDPFLEALKEVGMVSVTDIPSWNKHVLFETLERCIAIDNGYAASLTFADGTVRRTLATRSLAGHAEPLFDENGEANFHGVCVDGLRQESRRFRQAVQDLTDALSTRLMELMVDENGHSPIILKDASGDRSFNIQEVVDEGEHLEHFHCYYKQHTEDDSSEDDFQASVSSNTIDWHTDQGLLLVFTPGQRNGKATGGFFIQLSDGSAVEVAFDANLDDLVIMLGDGVNQFMNHGLEEKGTEPKLLRAVPHTLRLQSIEEDTRGGDDSPRVWYGRMVLPPPHAQHPFSAMTFEEIRSSMINKDPDALMLGCASHHQVARELGDGEPDGDKDALHCSNATSSYCWHECMNYTDYNVSPDICEERALSLGCVNDEGYLWVDEVHNKSFKLGCVDVSVAEYVKVPETDSPATAPTPTGAVGRTGYLIGATLGVISTAMHLLQS